MNRAPAGMSEPLVAFAEFIDERTKGAAPVWIWLDAFLKAGPRPAVVPEPAGWMRLEAYDNESAGWEQCCRADEGAVPVYFATPAMREPAPSSVDPAVPPSEEKK